MTYQIAAILMTLSNLEGHSPTANLFKCDFYSARSARIASAVLATAIPSVCPSVRPSVRLSHAGIVSKRRHVARCSFHRWIAECV